MSVVAAGPHQRPLRLVLWGDGQSPHLLKWAQALAAQAPRVELWAASSRAFLPAFDALVPPDRRLALGEATRFEGGNAALLKRLPAFARWLRQVDPDWVHAHYLTSHGTMAWLARAGWLRGRGVRIAGSAWGSDILVAPQRSALMRWLTGRVLRACDVTTSDSVFMARRMQALGAAGDVMTFPFGLDALPPAPPAKDDGLFYANRGLEPIYAPQRVLATFAAIAAHWPAGWPPARLVVAHDGSQRAALEAETAARGLGSQVRFVGRLDAAAQAGWYGPARWYLSLPQSDSVSVSVLEALGHGAIPLLSELPANRELVEDGVNGLILPDTAPGTEPDGAALVARLAPLRERGDAIAARQRAWVAAHALFAPSVHAFVDRLLAAGPRRASRPSA